MGIERLSGINSVDTLAGMDDEPQNKNKVAVYQEHIEGLPVRTQKKYSRAQFLTYTAFAFAAGIGAKIGLDRAIDQKDESKYVQTQVKPIEATEKLPMNPRYKAFGDFVTNYMSQNVEPEFWEKFHQTLTKNDIEIRKHISADLIVGEGTESLYYNYFGDGVREDTGPDLHVLWSRTADTTSIQLLARLDKIASERKLKSGVSGSENDRINKANSLLGSDDLKRLKWDSADNLQRQAVDAATNTKYGVEIDPVGGFLNMQITFPQGQKYTPEQQKPKITV